MKYRTWHGENLAVIGVLAAVIWWKALPLDSKTAGWALGAMAAHSARSHSIRKAEQSGQPHDWLADLFTVAGGAAVLLASEAQARILLGVPIGLLVGMLAWRYAYRRWWKPLPAAAPKQS